MAADSAERGGSSFSVAWDAYTRRRYTFHLQYNQDSLKRTGSWWAYIQISSSGRGCSDGGTSWIVQENGGKLGAIHQWSQGFPSIYSHFPSRAHSTCILRLIAIIANSRHRLWWAWRGSIVWSIYLKRIDVVFQNLLALLNLQLNFNWIWTVKSSTISWLLTSMECTNNQFLQTHP